MLSLEHDQFFLLYKTEWFERKPECDYAIIWKTVVQPQKCKVQVFDCTGKPTFVTTYKCFTLQIYHPFSGGFDEILFNMKKYWYLRTDRSTNITEEK